MTSFLSGSLAKSIGKAFKSTFLDAVLTRDNATAGGTPYDPSPTSAATYPCKAIFAQWSDYIVAGGLVKGADRKILILATSLAIVPDIGDRVTIDGVTLTIYSEGEGRAAVTTDPAKAIWTARART